jgi:hypothetical protein
MNGECYSRNARLTLKQIDNEYFLCGENGAGIFMLNQTAKSVWNLCDGDHDIFSISDELSSIYGVNKSYIAPKVEKIIEEFRNLGIIDNGE